MGSERGCVDGGTREAEQGKSVSDAKSKRRWSALLVAGAAVPILAWIGPPVADASGDTPLNWDMAGHVLTALRIGDAIRHGDVAGLAALLRAWSVYPPGYHLALGAWLALFGSGGLAVRGFFAATAAVAVLGLAVGLRPRRSLPRATAFLACGLILLGTGQYGSLVQSYMIDAAAVSMAMLSLGLIARFVDSDVGSSWIPVCLAMFATMLTKYNVGLPLAVAAGVVAMSAWFGGRRRRALVVAGAAAVAVAAWGLFLCWQDHGWQSFLEFARNRANTEGLSAGARAVAYARLYASRNFAWLGVPFLVALFAMVGISRTRDRFALACTAYGLAYAAAIVNHDYLLDRLLLPPLVVSIALCGVGMVAVGAWLGSRWPRSGWVCRALLVLGAVAAAGTNRAVVERELARMYPPENQRLEDVSRFVRDHIDGTVLGGGGFASSVRSTTSARTGCSCLRARLRVPGGQTRV